MGTYLSQRALWSAASLFGLVVLVFWIYYTSMILLLGAEIANLYADAQKAKRQKAAA